MSNITAKEQPAGVSECPFVDSDKDVTYCFVSRVAGDPIFGWTCLYVINGDCWREHLSKYTEVDE